jgi:superfamily II DNA or RNA helicase
LAKPSFKQLGHSGPFLTEAELGQLRDDLDIPVSVLRRLGSDRDRNILVLHNIKQLSRRHRRVIAFCATVDQAIQLAAVLNAQGLATRCVTSASSGETRKESIDWYRSDAAEPRVLTNYGVLTTGFDAPLTSAALIARPTKSLVLYSQMVGRAMRGPRAGGNRFSEIVTVVDTGLRGFGNVEDAFSNWEDVWLEQPHNQAN